MLKRGKTCTHWEWHGGISPEGQGDLPSLVKEDWYEESHLIHVSVWLSVSGPAGGMYKWASYYQGRIWGLFKWYDRGLKKITLLPSLNPLPVPPAQSLYFSSLLTFMADENKCGNCLSDLPSWSSQWLFSLSYLVSWKKLSCWHWASLRPKALVALGHYCLRSPVAPVDVVSCRSQTTASLNSAHLPTENWNGFSSWKLQSLHLWQQGDVRLKQVLQSQEAQLCQWDFRFVPVDELSIFLEDTKESEGL